MLFCSLEFLLFFTTIFAVYWVLPWRRGRVWLLLAASFFFYACWNKWLALLVCVSTALDYLIALAMERTARGWRRRLLLGVSLAVNLGLLCYFKYAGFFLQSLAAALEAAGASVWLPTLKVILPIGISFYTFEAINYTVDVYRGRMRAERSLTDFMLFILFFPHLVAGPIVRARDFLPQIKRVHRWDWARLHLGVQLFLMGLFKKLAIADRMAQFADPVFTDPLHHRTGAAWLAVFAYALQIYCDFSGYTDMALGAAHMLGYKLAQNFNMPYLACNVSEFWHRWHISLSTWLRDYIFIPLGGSRGTQWQRTRNLLVTMTLGGLWHGAAWTFVVWGLLHGVLLIVHRAFQCVCRKRPRLDALLQTAPGTLLRMAATFLAVCVGWVFFRATSFTTAAHLFERLVLPPGPDAVGLPLPEGGFWLMAGVVLVCHLLARADAWRTFSPRLAAPVLGVGYATVLAVTLLLCPDGGKPFIYFVF
jgi:alginate O-acetyltransferase complex protein AlgI